MLRPQVRDLRGVGADDECCADIADQGQQVRHVLASLISACGYPRRTPLTLVRALPEGSYLIGRRHHSGGVLPSEAGQGKELAVVAVDRTAAFERLRPRLRGLAYRMLGSVGDAEDVVQDTYLRWHQA